MRNLLRYLLLTTGLLLGSCTVSLDPGTTRITCEGSADCPDPLVCATSVGLCVPTDAEDSTAPVLLSASALPAVAGEGTRVVVTVAVDEPLLTPPVLTIVDGVGRTQLENAEALGLEFTHSYTASGTETEGPATLEVFLIDPAGNESQTDLTDTLAFDFTAPALADVLSFELIPGSSSSLTSVTAMTFGTRALLEFTTDEALGSATVTADDGVESFVFTCASTTVTTTCEFALSAASPPRDGTYALSAAVEDLAGNPASFGLATSLEIDTARPCPPDVSANGSVLYRRIPWGDGADGATASPHFTLQGGAGSVEADATVIVRSAAATAGEIARTRADSNGAFGAPLDASQPLLIDEIDRATVYVSALDAAGNESGDACDAAVAAPVAVANVAWTATLIGKVAGSDIENPHRFESRRSFNPLQLRIPVQPESGAFSLGQADGLTFATGGAGHWTRIDSLGQLRHGRYAGTAYDAARGRVVRFGGEGDCQCGSDPCGGILERQDGHWFAVPAADPEADGSPEPSSRGAMAYDARNGGVVLFGGSVPGSAPIDNNTWLWNGASWESMCATDPCVNEKPSARDHAAMASDPIRQRIVLFGGSTGGDETWEWDGLRWTQHCLSGACPQMPSARSQHAMAYDPISQSIILFGGTDGADETWSWDGTTWTLLCSAGACGPSPRIDHAMAFDSVRQTLWMVGGEPLAPDCSATPVVELDDVWQWDGSAWFDRTPAPADNVMSPAAGHGLVYDRLRDEVLAVGGRIAQCGILGGCLVDTNQFTESWRGTVWEASLPPRVPQGRVGHGLAFNPTRDRLVLAGGRDDGWRCDGAAVLADTYTWTGAEWFRESISGPNLGRCGAGLAWDPTGLQLIAFGGIDENNTLVDTTLGSELALDWPVVCDPATCPSPSARTEHAMVATPDGTLLFGGMEAFFARLDDTWLWDGTSWADACSPAPCSAIPPGRSGAAMAYDEARGEAVLFGGNNGGARDDLWVFSGGDWSQPTVVGPTPIARSHHAMAYDPSRQKTIMFGGTTLQIGVAGGIVPTCGDGIRTCGDAWEWDGQSWSPLTLHDPEGDGEPGPRVGAVMAYDPSRGDVILTGGLDQFDVQPQTTWRWNGGASERPAHVFKVPFVAAGVGRAVDLPMISAIEVRWLAGASGNINDTASAGVTLYVWDVDQWFELTRWSAPADSPQEMVWTIDGGSEDLRRLFIGRQRTLFVAASPTVENGRNYGEVVTDYVAVTIRFVQG